LAQDFAFGTREECCRYRKRLANGSLDSSHCVGEDLCQTRIWRPLPAPVVQTRFDTANDPPHGSSVPAVHIGQ
jgi:hypothetical protein